MDTRLLEDALVLLEEKSFSAAAARRNVTQPAFSRRIRALEDWIGHELLIRGANRIVISPSLAACEPQIRAMLAHLQQLRSQLKNFQNAGEPLVFASQHSLSLSCFPEVCQFLAAMTPPVVSLLRTQNQDDATSVFLRNEADVLIAYEHQRQAHLPFDDSISRHVWHRDVLVPIVGGDKRHTLTQDRKVPSDTNIIRFPTGSFFGKILNDHEERNEVLLDGPTILESAFAMGIARLVLAGIGAAWVPHSIVHREIMSGEAVILSEDYGRIPLDIVFFVHNSNMRAVAILEKLANA